MDTETLRWFQEVADGRTVTEVAQTYLVSQPAVSRALSRLEREVGAPLLQRSGRILRPTVAGHAFKRHVDAAIHHLDDAQAAVEQLLDPESGRVRLAFQPSLGTWLVPELVAAFQSRYPLVSFDLLHSDGTLGSGPLLEGLVDLELTARRVVNPEIRAHRLLREPLVLAVPPAHELAQRGEVWLRDVASSAFVMLQESRTLYRLTHELFQEAGIDPRIAFVADDLATVRGFVAAGLGVAVIPAGGADPSTIGVDGVRLIPIADAGAGRDIVLAWSAQRRLLPSAELFRSSVLKGSAQV